jgi:hypothetical protein
LIEVSVANQSEADIVLRRPNILFADDVKVILGDSIRENLSSQFGSHGTLIRTGGSCTITFHLPENAHRRGSYFALISWRRLSRLVAPTVPLIIRLPRAELERLAD